MNSDTIKGDGRDLGGQIKQAAGDVTGDTTLQGQGVVDQISGTVQKGYGTASDAITQNAGPLAEKAKQFARDRPWATAALLGTIGLAVINTLRGRK